ncbi:MAG: flippase, partial [Candidatus Pacearchaeota archaeon]|nr:flippase [Candidatus Pacearchaeota archaeon]
AFALAFVSMLVILADFGLPPILTREFAHRREAEKEFPSVLSLKILLSCVVLAVMLVASLFITSDPTVLKLIWIFSPFVLISNFFLLLFAFLQARQKMEYQALLKTGQAVLLLGAGSYVLFQYPMVENFAYAYLAANILALIGSLLFFHFRIVKLKLAWQPETIRKFVQLSWPLALATIFGALFVNIDSVMMGYFGQIVQTGWYNAAYRIIGAVVIPATLIATSFYPAMSKFFQESLERFQNILNIQLELMVVLAFPIAAGGLLLASRIIYFFYDPSFAPAIPAFQILVGMISISFLYGPFYSALLASGHQRTALQVTFWGALVNVILNLVLIPRYSLYGAAVAILIAQLVILLLAGRSVRRLLPAPLISVGAARAVLVAFFSTLLMVGAISAPLVSHLSVVLVVALGAFVYLAAVSFFVVRGIGWLSLKHWKTQWA